MRLRKNILPRTLGDALVTSFTFITIPIIYYFEIFIVLPTFFQLWGIWHIIHFILGTFVLFNVCSNLIAIMVCDTSIRGLVLSTRNNGNWRFCPTCETVAPPRSAHCDICKICILKKDHHCMFTSCCIGHCNQRYFAIFVLYVFISMTYTTVYNLIFIYDLMEFNLAFWSVVKVIFPLATLFLDFSQTQMYIFLIFIIELIFLFTGVLTVYHSKLIYKGMITYEHRNNIALYDMGWKTNFINIFGEKWHLTWLSPFIASEPTHNGIDWDTKHSSKAK